MVTEKSTRLQETKNEYTFEVEKSATKSQIKADLKRLYPDVTITAVRTIVVPSKPRGRFTKSGYVAGRSPVWKKAVVTLKEGDVIDLFEEV
jgi:large subunit ribosomal protein L23